MHVCYRGWCQEWCHAATILRVHAPMDRSDVTIQLSSVHACRWRPLWLRHDKLQIVCILSPLGGLCWRSLKQKMSETLLPELLPCNLHASLVSDRWRMMVNRSKTVCLNLNNRKFNTNISYDDTIKWNIRCMHTILYATRCGTTEIVVVYALRPRTTELQECLMFEPHHVWWVNRHYAYPRHSYINSVRWVITSLEEYDVRLCVVNIPPPCFSPSDKSSLVLITLGGTYCVTPNCIITL